MKQVAKEKNAREAKKKKQADEKRAEEERTKKSDLEKAKASKATISPPTIDDNTEASDNVMLLGIEDASTHTNWTDADDDEALARHGISPNHLFGKEAEETTNAETVDFSGVENFPLKKETRNAVVSLVITNNRYTTKSFSIIPTAHTYAHTRTFVEAAIALTKEDKPKEFIAAIKLLLTNRKILDHNFDLAPLKHDTATKKPKLILEEDDVPVNFTHLG